MTIWSNVSVTVCCIEGKISQLVRSSCSVVSSVQCPAPSRAQSRVNPRPVQTWHHEPRTSHQQPDQHSRTEVGTDRQYWSCQRDLARFSQYSEKASLKVPTRKRLWLKTIGYLDAFISNYCEDYHEISMTTFIQTNHWYWHCQEGRFITTPSLCCSDGLGVRY